jgi:hypothetical protein
MACLPRFKSFGLRNITLASIFLSMSLASSASSTDHRSLLKNSTHDALDFHPDEFREHPILDKNHP